MTFKAAHFVLFGALLSSLAGACRADDSDTKECADHSRPQILFIQFASPNIATRPVSELIIKGKLSIPTSPMDATIAMTAGKARAGETRM